jgi:hypothetical protein
LLETIKHDACFFTPYFDGNSSARVLDAAEKIIQSPSAELITKPHGLLRQFKMRKKLGYWKF